MSSQTQAIRDSATNLLALFDEVVPNTTVHYAVEDARRALRELARKADTIQTVVTYHVENNVTGARASRDWDTEKQASAICRELNFRSGTMQVGSPARMYGVYDNNGRKV